MKNLSIKIIIVIITLLTLGLFNSQVKADQKENTNKYTGTQFTKTFRVKLNKENFILFQSNNDWYSLMPEKEANQNNIKANHFYKAFYTKSNDHVFATVEYYEHDPEIKDLLKKKTYFSNQSIKEIADFEKAYEINWTLAIPFEARELTI